MSLSPCAHCAIVQVHARFTGWSYNPWEMAKRSNVHPHILSLHLSHFHTTSILMQEWQHADKRTSVISFDGSLCLSASVRNRCLWCSNCRQELNKIPSFCADTPLFSHTRLNIIFTFANTIAYSTATKPPTHWSLWNAVYCLILSLFRLVIIQEIRGPGMWWHLKLCGWICFENEMLMRYISSDVWIMGDTFSKMK